MQRVVSFTGHRPHKLGDPALLRSNLQRVLGIILKENPDTQFIVGGAPGFDTIALEVLLTMTALENIVVAVPFIGFEKYAGKDEAWNERARKLNQESGVRQLSVGGNWGTFAEKCNRRNEFLVNNATEMVAYCDGSPSGTRNTVNMAKYKNMKVTNLYLGQVRSR